MIIYDVLRQYHRFTKYDGAVGVEIETESLAPYQHPEMKFWTSVADGSLRHYGVEYVLAQPLNPGKDLDAALEEFRTKTAKFNLIQDSVSTSVHVHINLLNETFLTLANFLTVYALMENLLIRFSGPDRLSNLFCLPMCDAEDTVDNIISLFYTLDDKSGFRGVGILNQDRMKYSALNLASLATRGSLESRCMRGVTDTDMIRDWVNALYNMLQYAKRDITPLDILAQWKATGTEMLEDVFGDKHRLFDFPDKYELMKKNLWAAGKIGTFICMTETKDWRKFAQFEPKKVGKKPKKQILIERDNMAIAMFDRGWDALAPGEQIVVIEEMERQPVAVQEAEQPDVGIPVGNIVGNLGIEWDNLRRHGLEQLRNRDAMNAQRAMEQAQAIDRNAIAGIWFDELPEPPRPDDVQMAMEDEEFNLPDEEEEDDF